MFKLNPIATKKTAKIVGITTIASVVGISIALYVPMAMIMSWIGVAVIVLAIREIYIYQSLKEKFNKSQTKLDE